MPIQAQRKVIKFRSPRFQSPERDGYPILAIGIQDTLWNREARLWAHIGNYRPRSVSSPTKHDKKQTLIDLLYFPN